MGLSLRPLDESVSASEGLDSSSDDSDESLAGWVIDLLTNLLGGQGMGVYQMVYPLYCLLLTLASAGVPAGLSRIVSVWEARGIPSRGVLSRALLLFGAVGGAGSLLMLAAAGGVSRPLLPPFRST